MLRTVNNLIGHRVLACGEGVGRVYDFYIDDRSWRIRYLIVEIGRWPARRRVLIARPALEKLDGDRREFQLGLTREQVEGGPDFDAEKPVCRQQEALIKAGGDWPAGLSQRALRIPLPILDMIENRERTGGDPHLRSFREISCYGLRHLGRVIATVKDALLEDSDWSVRDVVVSTGGWLGGRDVSVPTASITYVSWARKTLTTTISMEALEQFPEFHATAAVNQEVGIVYFDYCGRPVSRTSSESVESD